jgi:hypothetical protein
MPRRTPCGVPKLGIDNENAAVCSRNGILAPVGCIYSVATPDVLILQEDRVCAPHARGPHAQLGAGGKAWARVHSIPRTQGEDQDQRMSLDRRWDPRFNRDQSVANGSIACPRYSKGPGNRAFLFQARGRSPKLLPNFCPVALAANGDRATGRSCGQRSLRAVSESSAP